jgi:uncharacterized protein (TIGR03437 family)
VASAETNSVTIVDFGAQRIVATVPVRSPAAIGSFDSRSVFIASAGDNKVYLYNSATLQLEGSIDGIPGPVDFLPRGIADCCHLAVTAARSSVVRLSITSPYTVAEIGGVPGAAAISHHAGVEPEYRRFAFVSSPDTDSVFVVSIAPPPPVEFGVGNGASFATVSSAVSGGHALAAGSLLSAFAETGVTQAVSAQTIPLPVTLGGLTLKVGGRLSFDGQRWLYSPEGAVAAPLLFAGSRQVNFQAPTDLASGDPVPIQITRADGTTQISAVRVATVAPGIFTALSNGQGQAAALNQDNTPNFAAQPAERGTVIQLFATGAGATNPALPSGHAAPISGNPLILTQIQPTVNIGGKNARVLFSGLAPGFVGVWQINAEIPANVTPGPAVDLWVEAGGVVSNRVTIAVR